MIKEKKYFSRKRKVVAAAITILAVAAAFFSICILSHPYRLTVRNAEDGSLYSSYPLDEGEWFSITFIHSVNKSPVTDCYQIKNHSMYVEKTVYYGFGAGVQTEIEPGQKLEYGDDGSMIVSGFDLKMSDLTYFVGTVSDHTLVVNDGKEISLRELCGKNSRVRFQYERVWFWE